MPATSSSNNPRFTTDSNNNSGGNLGGGARTGIGGGGGGGSTAAARTNDTGRDSPTTPTFLERHGHTPMNLDVQVLSSQNGTRGRAESSPAPPSTSSVPATTTTAPPSAAATGPAPAAADGKISIRIVPAMDSFTRLPLRFDPIDRKVDNGEVLVVGRHTDRLVSEHPNAVVFRSKVVSRNHAKMWSSNGQWYLQDVGSSSGTFLNHIRLSPPNVESTPYTIKDGDIVQLGIDFRGGTEEVFRCVKMRIETNNVGARISDYNVAAHRQLRQNLEMRKTSDASPNSLSECSICLYPIGPGQALFVAACSHTWHFKCIRPIITEHFPLFMCPNCRQDADLEAPVDVETETWEAILRTTDPRTPTADAGTSRDPQVKIINFHPITELTSHIVSQRESRLANDMESLSLTNPNERDRSPPMSPDRELGLTRTLTPSLAPIVENDASGVRTPRATALIATPPIGISRRIRALSATRDAFEDLASLSATPTIDRGPFVYGDMTVNADGSAEATTSNGSVVQLPRESISDDANPLSRKMS